MLAAQKAAVCSGFYLLPAYALKRWRIIELWIANDAAKLALRV